MLAQRKYESRVASSCGEIRTVAALPAAGRSRSIRKRKSGETRIACRPTASPSSNEPSSFCARRTSATYFSISRAVTGRLNARLAKLVTMRGAHVGWCAPVRCPQV